MLIQSQIQIHQFCQDSIGLNKVKVPFGAEYKGMKDEFKD